MFCWKLHIIAGGKSMFWDTSDRLVSALLHKQWNKELALAVEEQRISIIFFCFMCFYYGSAVVCDLSEVFHTCCVGINIEANNREMQTGCILHPMCQADLEHAMSAKLQFHEI